MTAPTLPPPHQGKTERENQASLSWARGVEALTRQDYFQAAAFLREATLLNPRHASAHNDLGVLMEALGNPHEAQGCYQSALKADPHHAEARSNLAQLTLQMDLASALHHRALAFAQR